MPEGGQGFVDCEAEKGGPTTPFLPQATPLS
jgi:hypothetical protein